MYFLIFSRKTEHLSINFAVKYVLQIHNYFYNFTLMFIFKNDGGL